MGVLGGGGIDGDGGESVVVEKQHPSPQPSSFGRSLRKVSLTTMYFIVVPVQYDKIDAVKKSTAIHL